MRSVHVERFKREREILISAKDALQYSVRLRKRARSVETNVLDDSLQNIERLTENISEVVDQIVQITSGQGLADHKSVKKLDELDLKLHRLAVEVVSWESLVEGIAGLWDGNYESLK